MIRTPRNGARHNSATADAQRAAEQLAAMPETRVTREMIAARRAARRARKIAVDISNDGE